MEASHRSLLRRSRVDFAKDLVLEEVAQILLSKDILSDRMVEEIFSKPTAFDRNAFFMSKLQTRGPRAFNSFYEALLETDQNHLANILHPLSPNTAVSSEDVFPSEFTFSETTQKSLYPNFDVSSIHTTSPNSGKFSIISGSAIPTKVISPLILEKQSCASGHVPVEHDMIIEECVKTHNPTISTPKTPKTTNTVNFEELRSCSTIENLREAAGLMKINDNNHCISSDNCLLPSSTDSSGGDAIVCDAPTWSNVQVRACKEEFFLRNMNMCYNLFGKCKGVALLISVTQFDESACLDDRMGGQIDCARLEIMFKQLSYHVYKLLQPTSAEIKNTVKNFSQWPELANYDSCFIVLMSHGEKDCIFGRDGSALALADIYSCYTNDHCPLLQNKPKVFLVQACRGKEPDKGVDQLETPSFEKKKVAKRLLDFEMPIVRNKLPTMSDTLFAYATVPGFAAMRNTEKGSWFIQAFIQVVAHHAKDRGLHDILTMTNNQVKGREGYSPDSDFHRCKEMSEFTSSLCKPFFFFPGIYQAQTS